MEEMGVIDRFLETFIAYIDSGFGLLAGDVAYLTTTLIVIDITLAGLFWALSQNADVISGLLKKVLYVGFFAFILGNFSILANILFASFADLGVKAGSSTLTAEDLMRPGYIAGVGFEAAQPLLQEIGDMLGPIRFFHNFILIAVMLIAWAIILVAFFVLAVQLFVAILEFKLTTLAGFVLVPFALWNKTSFLAERVLGNVVTSGIKLMVLAIVIGIGSTLFTSITDAFGGPGDVTLAEVMGTVLASGRHDGCCWCRRCAGNDGNGRGRTRSAWRRIRRGKGRGLHDRRCSHLLRPRPHGVRSFWMARSGSRYGRCRASWRRYAPPDGRTAVCLCRQCLSARQRGRFCGDRRHHGGGVRRRTVYPVGQPRLGAPPAHRTTPATCRRDYGPCPEGR